MIEMDEGILYLVTKGLPNALIIFMCYSACRIYYLHLDVF